MNEAWLDRWLLDAVHCISHPVQIRMDSKAPSCDRTLPFPGAPIIRVKDRKTLLALWLNPEMNFGDLYSEGRIEIEGDLVRMLEMVYDIPQQKMTRIISSWLGWIQANNLITSRKNIHHHYDLPADFYGLWLDPQMVYTCAYFPNENASLEEAQVAKLDLVCRKKWLKPDETVVEAGCGWGALALHMARHYGVRVKAFNISHEQIEFARAQARREGLTSRVEFLEDDYRNIVGHYDAFVSVGMLEHVGSDYYPGFARVLYRAIGDHGRALLHFIGKSHPEPFSTWIRKRIFPGAYAPVLSEVTQALEPYDFCLLDMENLRSHYARTLECWLHAFERSYETVAERFGTAFARMWQFYLAGSIAGFRVGSLQLFQLLLAGKKCNSIPSTRERLYIAGHESNQRNAECIPATY
jgi:cyclopropane-fatty-acyl-phospholipid synthase